jgi:hypothetical protein
VSVIATGTNPTAGKPTSTIRIGNINGGALNGSGVYGGYHLGMSLTTQNAADWAEIMHGMASLAGRQECVVLAGDSLTGSGTWGTLLTTNTLPRRSLEYVSAGGISSATLLTNMIAAIAANPSIKYRNTVLWIGQNDSGVGGWDGSNTLSNSAAILALLPHTRYRVVNMIYKNLPSEYIGQSVRSVKDSVSAAWAALHGAKCRNIRDILVNGGTGTGQDAVDLANGVTPSSLHKTLSAYNISTITKAANASVTSAAQPFVVGDCLTFAAIGGMTELNGVTAQCVTVADTTHCTINKDSTGHTTYTSGGTATLVDSIHINPTGDALIEADLATSISGGWV